MGIGDRAFDGVLLKDSSMLFVIPPGLLHSKSNLKILIDVCSVIVCQTEYLRSAKFSSHFSFTFYLILFYIILVFVPLLVWLVA